MRGRSSSWIRLRALRKRSGDAGVDRVREVEKLHAKIEQLIIERDFLAKRSGNECTPDRRALVDRGGELSMRRQCALLGVTRSGVHRPPPAANDDDDLPLQRRIDELFTAWPFLGSRRMTALLRAEGHPVNRKRVRRLMRKMGIAALGPKPRTTKPAPRHKIFPYLLRGLTIERPNQVRVRGHRVHSDPARLPLSRRGHGLVSRAVLAWRLSNTMDTSFCVAALQEALARFGRPEIFNTDQGSRFISMDSRGRWMDNVFIERLWRSLKYDDIYLKG